MRLIILFFLFGSFAMAEDCQSFRLQESAPSNQSLQSITDLAINSSVTLVNQDIEKSVEKKLLKFKISTEMLATKNPTKEALADWYLNMVNLNKVAFDEIRKLGIINDESALQRLSLTVVNGIVSTWIEQAAKLSMHEKSHGEAALAAGADSVWYSTQKNPDHALTIGGLFKTILTGGGSAATWYNSNKEFSPKELAIISSAGLNQQTKFSEQLAKDSSDVGKFHQAELMPYLVNKLSVPLYYLNDKNSGLSDLKSYTNALVAQGKIQPGEVDATMSKMAQYATVSALLSGRTWEGLQATMNYVQKGNTTADTLKINTPVGDVTWPEVSTYLNSDNISVKANTTLLTKSKNTNYDFSIEKSVIGNNVSEVSATANMKIDRATIATTAVANTQNKYGAKVHVSYDIDGKGKWVVFGDVSYDTGTLEGKRMSLQTDNSPQTRMYTGIEYRIH